MESKEIAARIRAPRLLYVVSEDWYFLSHRLPMARAATAAGFEVHVATRVVDGAEAIAREGFVLHPIPFVRGQIAPFSSLQTILALRRLHRQIRPDLVHRVAIQPVILDGLATLGQSTTAINAITGLGYAFVGTSPGAHLLRFIISRILRQVVGGKRSVLLVQNPDDGRALHDIGIDPDRIVLVPGSGVDVDVLVPLPESEAPITVGFAGRVIESKGIRVLIEAHRILCQRGAPVNLLIAGNPDPANPASVTKTEIEVWTREPGVAWLGHVDAIGELWARAHIAVLPSRGGEGVPKSLLEAAAHGRALIASDVPGCRDIVIDRQTGLLVPPNDPVALADAIAELAATPDLRAQFATAARRLAVERFSTAAVSVAITGLYRRLASHDKNSSLTITSGH